jgi:hypothetical protein
MGQASGRSQSGLCSSNRRRHGLSDNQAAWIATQGICEWPESTSGSKYRKTYLAKESSFANQNKHTDFRNLNFFEKSAPLLYCRG